MDAGNTFAVVTTLSFLALMPLALYFEGQVLQSRWQVRGGV